MDDVPPPIEACVEDLVRVLRGVLGRRLVGIYLGGSVALGDFTPGRSDLDVAAVISEPLDDAARLELIERVSGLDGWCRLRGVELVVYLSATCRRPPRRPPFELNLNVGPGMADHATWDAADEPGHWFLIDLAILREHGVRVTGPPPGEVFGEIPRHLIRDAVRASADWHARHEPDREWARVNALRAERFLAEGRWISKDEAVGRGSGGGE